MRRRRLLAAGGASLAGLASLAGCGGSDEEEADGTGGSDGAGGLDTDTPLPEDVATGTPETTDTPTPSGNLGPELVVENRDATSYRVAVRIRPEEGESVFEGFISVPGGARVEREVAFDGPGTYLVEIRIRSEEARERWAVEAADPRAAVVVTIEDGTVTFGRRTPE